MISFRQFVRSAALALVLLVGGFAGAGTVMIASTAAEAAVISSIVVSGNTRRPSAITF
jgi:2-phosphoglycerate kinase